MPYIPKTERKRYDETIVHLADLLLDKLPANNGTDFSEGDFNYIVSKLTWILLDVAPSYQRGNKLVGALECIKQEFIRRRLNDYEDKKIKENGDLKT